MLNYEFKKIKDIYILRLNKGAEIIQSIKDFIMTRDVEGQLLPYVQLHLYHMEVVVNL